MVASKTTGSNKSSKSTENSKAKDKPKKEVKKETPKKPKKNHLSAHDMAMLRELLISMRERITGELTFLADDNLNRSSRDVSGDLSNYSIHMADQGTDNFDREFALSLVSNEQDIIYEIDEALQRMDKGTYGYCEVSGEPIEKERLKAIPYTRYSIAAQTELERGRSPNRPRRVSDSLLNEAITYFDASDAN